MNQWDRDNLEFLLKAPANVIKEWYAQITPDDLDYAFELLAMRHAELDEQEQALLIECELEAMNEFKDANQVLDSLLKR